MRDVTSRRPVVAEPTELRMTLACKGGEDDPSRPMRFNVEVTYLSRDKKKQIVVSWVP